VTSGPWVMQSSGTSASFRGIHAVGGGVAWASGTNGTVLRTEDGGYEWQSCAMPPGAEKLDFRGIWAWDDNTAIVMSSGPDDQSRLYKTTDGCSHWKLLFTNPDKDGFWDAMVFNDQGRGFVLGDPVNGRFVLLFTLDRGKTWGRVNSTGLNAGSGKIGAFAASNSSLLIDPSGFPWFGTSGPGGPWLYTGGEDCTMLTAQSDPAECFRGFLTFDREKLPMSGDSPSAGIFSLGADPGMADVLAVGGDYQKPDQTAGVAARWWSQIRHWTAATQPPHGYRSAVAWDPDAHAWIAVGPNGSDISRDDGKTWQPLDGAETGGNWNALSLPWVVGPNGRIAKLDPDRLKKVDSGRLPK
jgi:hypothetical protein